MRQFLVFLSLSALFCSANAADAHKPATETKAPPAVKLPSPEELLPKLNDDDFEVRFDAYRKLEAMGESIRPALEKATASHDEIGEQARHLLENLNRTSLDIMAFDRDGKPATGAEADLTLNGYDGRQPAPESIAIKDDGTAKVENKKPGQYYGYFNWKKGFSLIDQTHAGWFKLKSGPVPYFFTLSRCATIKTVLLDSDGKPLSGARLMLLPSNQYDEQTLECLVGNNQCGSNLCAASGEDGKLTLEGVPEGVYQYVISHESHEPIIGTALRTHEGDNIDLPLQWMIAQPRGKVQVTLLRRDGAPLAKAQASFEFKRVVYGPELPDAKKNVRNVYNNWNRGNMQLQQQTDDDGKFNAENVKAGRYILTVSAWDPNAQQQYNPWGQQAPLEYQSEAIVIDPEKPLEITLTPLSGGAVFGRVVNGSEKGVRGTPVFAVPEDLISDPDFAPFDENGYANYIAQTCKTEWTHGSGIFKFQRLKPGRYALVIRTPSGDRAIVNGIEVQHGKMTTVPDIVLPDAKDVVHLKDIKGRILLPDGSPASQANVQIQLTMASQNASTSWGHQADGDGAFEFGENARYYDQWYTPHQLTVTKPGYKTTTIDLQKLAVPMAPLVIKLEKRGVGKLTVKALDDSGKPLRDVEIRAISPRQHYYNNYNYGYHAGKRSTDRNGEIQLSGMADGERKIIAVLDGYFCDEEILTKIVADGETRLTVTMHTGLQIAGRLEGPEGAAFSKSVAVLRSEDYQTLAQPIKDDGTFVFNGLPPGKYALFAQSPGLIVPQEIKLVLKPDQKEPLPATVKMVRATGVALNLGADHAGCYVQLVPTDWAAQLAGNDWNIPSRSQAVLADAGGRAEIWGLGAGEYRVEVTAKPNYNYNYYYNNNRTEVAGARVLGSVTVAQLGKVLELRDAPAVEVKDTEKLGSVTLQLDTKPAAAVKNQYGYCVYFHAVGENGVSSFNYSPRGIKADEKKTLVIGPSPHEFKAREPNGYTLKDLSPGKYKLFAKNYVYANRFKPDDKKAFEPIAEFTVKAGETVDIGSIPIPAPPPEAMLDPKDENDFSGEQTEFLSTFNP